jgi:hypothetical protein
MRLVVLWDEWDRHVRRRWNRLKPEAPLWNVCCSISFGDHSPSYAADSRYFIVKINVLGTINVLKVSVSSSSRGVGVGWKPRHWRCYQDQSAPTADGSTSQSNRCSRRYLWRQRLATLHKRSSRTRMMDGGANEERRALTDGTSDGSGDRILEPRRSHSDALDLVDSSGAVDVVGGWTMCFQTMEEETEVVAMVLLAFIVMIRLCQNSGTKSTYFCVQNSGDWEFLAETLKRWTNSTLADFGGQDVTPQANRSTARPPQILKLYRN